MTRCRQLCLFLLAVLSLPANATPWDEIFAGFGRAALQDSVADPRDPFAAAGLVSHSPAQTQIGMGFASWQPALGERATEKKPAQLLFMAGQFEASHFPAGPLRAGAFLLLPMADGFRVDTGALSGPVSPWALRAAQLHLQPHVSVRLLEEKLGVGFAFPIAFDTVSETVFRFDSAASTMRVRSNVQPRVGVQMGVDYADLLPGLRLSLSYQERQMTHGYISVDGVIPGPFNFNLLAAGDVVLAFEPRRLTAQIAYALSPTLELGVMARVSNWAEMPVPALALIFVTPAYQSAVPSFRARNSWDVGAGARWQTLEWLEVQGSYRFQQSPFSGNTLYYDSDQHVIGAGLLLSGNGVGPSWRALSAHLAARAHLLSGGGLYSWVGLGLGYRP